MKTKLIFFMKNAMLFLVQCTLNFAIPFFCISFGFAQSNSNCLEGGILKLNEIENDTITYRAKKIQSQQQIEDNSKVKYLANDRITLDTDFSILKNVRFNAGIAKECGTLKEKVDTQSIGVLCSANGLEIKLKSLEAFLPKCEEDKEGKLPEYEYLWNFGDGNFKTFKSKDSFIRETKHRYEYPGFYDVSVQRVIIKFPPDTSSTSLRNKFTEEEFNLTTLAREEIEIEDLDEDTTFSNETMDEPLRLTFIPEDPIAGQLLTVVSSFKSQKRNKFSVAKLSFDKDTLMNGNMNIYYCDTDGTDSCTNNLKVNVLDIEPNEQRNFFSYFTVKPDLEVGDSFQVCLNYQMKDTCKTAKIGNPHDPSFKRLENIYSYFDDELDFLIHMENDGTDSTDSIVVVDYFDPPLPCVEIEDIVMDEEDKITDCQNYPIDAYFVERYENNESSAYFEFNELVLRGQTETPIPPFNSTKDEFTFTLKLNQPILDPTYWCNKADIFFDEEPPFTVETCFYSFGKNYELMNGLIPPTKEYFVGEDGVRKIKPTLFKDNLFTTIDNQTITLSPDISELSVAAEDLEYIWWPNQETSSTLTVRPTENTNYRLFVSWMQNDTLCFSTDYVFVETQCFYGCTNKDAFGYDPFAQCDDYSCRYCEEESNDTIFEIFPWLGNRIDIDFCIAENIKITHYKRNHFDIVGIDIEGDVDFYHENGSYLNVREDSMAIKYLNQEYTICSWQCEGEKRTLCDTYPWLSNFYNSNVVGAGPITINGGTTISINSYFANIIKSYKYYGNKILYIVDEDGNGIVYVNSDSNSNPPEAFPYYVDNGNEAFIDYLISVGINIQPQKSWECQTINCPQ